MAPRKVNVLFVQLTVVQEYYQTKGIALTAKSLHGDQTSEQTPVDSPSFNVKPHKHQVFAMNVIINYQNKSYSFQNRLMLLKGECKDGHATTRWAGKDSAVNLRFSIRISSVVAAFLQVLYKELN